MKKIKQWKSNDRIQQQQQQNANLIFNLPMVRELRTQRINKQFLNFLVGFGNQINVAQFLFHIFTLPKSAGNQLKWTIY